MRVRANGRDGPAEGDPHRAARSLMMIPAYDDTLSPETDSKIQGDVKVGE